MRKDSALAGDFIVRPATPEDATTILRLVHELAAFEGEPPSSVKLTEADILRDGFGPEPHFEVLLAESDGIAVGLALFFATWSTWEGRAGLYVQDLYVGEQVRGHGLGRRLLAEVAATAEARGYTRIDLSVLDWNPARQFYERLGFAEMAEWRSYRLDGAAIAELATEAGAKQG
jgi:GNAT superfamily N-acetyltransferase